MRTRYRTHPAALFTLSVFLIYLAGVICDGGIMLTVVEDSSNSLTVEYFGSKVNPITDEEGSRFGLLPEDRCLEKIGRVKGHKPNYCYLNGEVHDRFQWRHVESVYAVQELKLVREVVTPVIIHREVFENEQDVDSHIKVYIKSEIHDSIEHQNLGGNEIKLGGTVGVVYRAVSGQAETAYEHTWGRVEKKSHKKVVEIGASSETVLGPRSNLTVELSGVRKKAIFDITYQNYVTGVVIGDYYYKYKNHHYHGMDVDRILPLSCLVQYYKERIQIDHYKAEHIKLSRTVSSGPATVTMLEKLEFVT